MAVRIDPHVSFVAPRQSLTSQSDEAQLDGLRAGKDLKDTLPMFPESRRCRDPFWAILFLLLSVAVLAGCFMHSHHLTKFREVHPNTEAAEKVVVRRLSSGADEVVMRLLRRLTGGDEVPDTVEFHDPIASMFAAVMGGVLAGVLCSMTYMYLLKAYPFQMIRGTLLFMPVLFFALAAGFGGYGAYLIASNFSQSGSSATLANTQAHEKDMGLVLAGMGGIFFVCFLCAACYAMVLMSSVPFAAQVMTAVMEVISLHPSMFLVGLCGVLLSALWVILSTIAGAGLLLEHQEQLKGYEGAHYPVLFVWVFVTSWGSMISMNLTIVAYAGVFGRWYFQSSAGPDRRSVMESTAIALTTSFGSVCFGSFIVAAIRALEAVARHMMEDAKKEGNIVMLILSCVVKFLLDCIGDIIEYFNAWAYIQCAVRNASFVEAAKITWSMCTCANVMLIVADCLLGWIAGMGTMLSAVVGLFVGGLLGFSLAGDTDVLSGDYPLSSDAAAVAYLCAIVAFFSALITGSTMCDVLSTGTKTILVLWAEDAAPLQRSHPEIHSVFEGTVRNKLSAAAGEASVPAAAPTAVEMTPVQGQKPFFVGSK